MHTRDLLLACAIPIIAACGGGPAEPLTTPPAQATVESSTDVEPSTSASAAEPPAPSADAQPAPEPQPEPEPSTPPPPPEVELAGEANFMGDGEVPKVEAFLDRMREGTAACVAEHGGLSEPSGEMKLQFLVRLRGRAEGVDVLSSKGVSKEAERCVRELFKNKRVGTPTSDPVGVQFRYRFKPA